MLGEGARKLAQVCVAGGVAACGLNNLPSGTVEAILAGTEWLTGLDLRRPHAERAIRTLTREIEANASDWARACETDPQAVENAVLLIGEAMIAARLTPGALVEGLLDPDAIADHLMRSSAHEGLAERDENATNRRVFAHVVRKACEALIADAEFYQTFRPRVDAKLLQDVASILEGQAKQTALLHLILEELARLRPQADPPSRLFDLPPVPDHFTGRESEIAALGAALTGERAAGVQVIAGLRGIGGIGKSGLAARVAHAVKDDFPDAHFVLDLGGKKPRPLTPEQALGDVLRRFRPDLALPEGIEQRQEIYRAILGQVRALILFDDALDTAQVAPLLPPSPSAALITSRAHIALVGAPEPLLLKDFERGESVDFLNALLPGEDAGALDALAAACCDHPLALKVAAKLYPLERGFYDGLAAFAAEIATRRDRLRLDGDADADVMGSLRLGLDALARSDAALAERWRDLSVFVLPFDLDGAASVWEVETDAAREVLRALLARGFVEDEGGGRFSLHDLMRDLARHGQGAGRFDAPEQRHGELFRARLAAADDLYLSGHDGVLAGLAAYDAMAPEIRAALERAAARLPDAVKPGNDAGDSADSGDSGLTYALANAGVYLFALRLTARERAELWAQARASAVASGNREHEGAALGNLGIAYLQMGEPARAAEVLEQYLAIAREIGDRRGEGNALGNLGIAYLQMVEPARAVEVLEQRLEIAREIGDRRGEGNALGNLGVAYKDMGEPALAVEAHKKNLEIAREIGDRRGEGNALGNLAIAYRQLGETDAAIRYYGEQRELTREIGDRPGEGNALHNMANAHRLLGDFGRARELALEALAIREDIGDPNIASTRRLLARIEARDSTG